MRAEDINEFGHPADVLESWRGLVRPLLGRHPTPFYLFSRPPIEQALGELSDYFGRLPVRHWLSCKTQPLRPLLRWWRQGKRGIEVVSEFEFLAARREGFKAGEILINGPAKHHWLPRHAQPGLAVNFDSTAEIRALTPLAKRLQWTVGIRVQTREEFDPQTPEFPTQFGFTPEEAGPAIQYLQRTQVQLATIHFHLRTNVASSQVYERALRHASEICRAARFSPRNVDCGGGFPPPFVRGPDGRPVNATFNLAEMARVYERALKRFNGAREIWLENGRWLTARSGVLVVKILDVKDRPKMRHLICDGGRTLNALVSNWETHALAPLPARPGPKCLTTVSGPTCMAFDQLARRPLPQGLRPGDHLLWLDAGAYHLPWETRFSHGRPAVFWHDGTNVKQVRHRESFQQWWEE